MSETPETDALDSKWDSYSRPFEAIDLARKLERERNEAIEKHRFAVIHWQIGVFKMQRERDEAREALEFRRELYTVQESYLELARRERDDWARLCGQYKQERDEALSKNTK